MSRKGDWSNAPRWANYRAMDMDGIWYWHQYEPEFLDNGKWDNIGTKQPVTFASDTLERRPAEN